MRLPSRSTLIHLALVYSHAIECAKLILVSLRLSQVLIGVPTDQLLKEQKFLIGIKFDPDVSYLLALIIYYITLNLFWGEHAVV